MLSSESFISGTTTIFIPDTDNYNNSVREDFSRIKHITTQSPLIINTNLFASNINKSAFNFEAKSNRNLIDTRTWQLSSTNQLNVINATNFMKFITPLRDDSIEDGDWLTTVSNHYSNKSNESISSQSYSSWHGNISAWDIPNNNSNSSNIISMFLNNTNTNSQYDSDIISFTEQNLSKIDTLSSTLTSVTSLTSLTSLTTTTTTSSASASASASATISASASASASVPVPASMFTFNNYDADVNIAVIDNEKTIFLDKTDYNYDEINGWNSSVNAILLNQSLEFERSHHQRNENVIQIINKVRGSGVHNGDILLRGDLNGANGFMLLLEDLGEYFYNYNDSTISTLQSSSTLASTFNNLSITNFDYNMNCTIIDNVTNLTTSLCYETPVEVTRNYWALILIVFPIFTLFGNILVILSVIRERSLQTVTNYFIVSLAIADLLVAVIVMPFAVYALVNVTWGLPYFACDFYIAMDVICSTSSIFNLVAISVDRYIAVTQPIKYAKHRNSRRVCLTIVMVWAISAAIGSPIVLGLNNTPNRDPSLCMFYNTDFILYSSLSSFYIPCIIMVFLYWNIFKALRNRARKQRAARKTPNISEMTGGSVIENIAQTRKLAETTLDDAGRQQSTAQVLTDELATNTGSGSNEEEEDNVATPDIEDCHVIVNEKSTEFMLATVVEETGNVVAQITSQPKLIIPDTNGIVEDSSQPDSPIVSGITLPRSTISSKRETDDGESFKQESTLSAAMKPISLIRYGVQEAMSLARHDSTISATSKTSNRKDKKSSQSSRFTLYKVHKPSKKKREKSSAKKERKATKTLAIVLGVFLFCWLPFFSCNIMDAMCSKFNKDCSPGVTAFIFTTWLGYINSFVNPVIYTIFNPEFRKAFKKIMHIG